MNTNFIITYNVTNLRLMLTEATICRFNLYNIIYSSRLTIFFKITIIFKLQLISFNNIEAVLYIMYIILPPIKKT